MSSSSSDNNNKQSGVAEEWKAFVKNATAGGSVRQEPAKVFEWKDTETEATGWVVWDRVINEISGGGIFMHPNATREETADIAYNMSRKFTVCVPQIGGAKGGIRFDHRDARHNEVVRRFITAHKDILATTWVTAGDLNTDDVFIESVVRDLGLVTSQGALGRKMAENTRNPAADRSASLAQLINSPATQYFPLIEGTVGCGLAEAIFTAVALHSHEFPRTHKTADAVRVAIQGFGAVGSSLGYYLEYPYDERDDELFVDVVCIADKDGFIVNPNGIDIDALLGVRAVRLAEDLAGASDAVRKESQKNFMCNFTSDAELIELLGDETRVFRRTEPNTPAGDEDFLVRMLQSCDAEVVSLCGPRYALTKNVVERGLLGGCWSGADGKRVPRAKILACGANNPYGVISAETGAIQEDRVYAVADQLVDANVCIVPDWVGNSGTAQLFHRALSLDFDLAKPAKDLARDVLQACSEPIRAFIKESFALVGNQPQYILLGAEKLAQARIANPPPLTIEAKPAGWSPSVNPKGEAEVFVNALAAHQANLIALVGMNHPVLDTNNWPNALVKDPHVRRSPYALPPLPKDKQLALPLRVELCRSLMIEVIDKGRTLEQMLAANEAPTAYDGFEPSGRMHLAQGIMKGVIVNRLTRAGFTFLFWVADWFAWMNHKMGGDLEAIKTVGKYMIEVWRASGMDMSRVRFLWASEEFDRRHNEYWPLVIEIATRYNLNETKRCASIMGRQAGDEMYTSELLYPCMQCADVFFLGVDVCQLGLDQRKVNKLARAFAGSADGKRRKLKKPIVLSHPMIAGLKQGQEKMSKSDPETSIFMEDTAADVARKIRGAFCPERVVDGNPVCNYLKNIVFPRDADTACLPLRVGALAFNSYEEFATAYTEGKVHPSEIKPVLTERINSYLEPVRKHFADNAEARALLERVRTLTAKYAKKDTSSAAAPAAATDNDDELASD